MTLAARHPSILWLALTLILACDSKPSDPRTGNLTLSASTAAAYDVSHIEFKIVADGDDCSATPVIPPQVVALEDEGLPDGFGLGGDGHRFADGLFVVPVGDYVACIQPLQDNAIPATPSVLCAPASQAVTVISGATTEILIVSQCGGEDQGGLDVVLGLNTEPHIETLTILPSKFIQTCELAQIDVTVVEPDSDVVSLTWDIVSQPAGASPTFLGDAAPTDEVGTATFEAEDAGTYILRVTATESPHGGSDQLEFPIHVSGYPCTAPTSGWMVNGGTVAPESVYDVTVDGDGNVFATGVSVAFHCAPDVQTCTATDTAFIFKYDANGNPLWAQQMGNLGRDEGRAVVTTDAGDVIVAGTIEANVDFGCGVEAVMGGGGTDVFLVALSGVDGSCLWSEVFGGSLSDYVSELVISKSANGEEQVTMGGYFFSAQLDIEGFSPLVNQGLGTTDMFLIRRRAADGSHLWSRREGLAGNDLLLGLGADEAGAMVISGAYTGPGLVLGSGPTGVASSPNNGSFDFFVARLLGDGTPVWINSAGGPGADYALGAAIDPDGNAVSCGTVTIGGNTAPFVSKISSDSQGVWTSGGVTAGNATAARCSADAFGNVVVFGHYDGTLDWGEGGITATGTQDLFVAGLRATDGQGVWSLSGGSSATDQAEGLAVDGLGNVYIAGGQGLDLGTGFSLGGSTAVDNAGAFDLFFGKLVP